jgi:hypothetical protein
VNACKCIAAWLEPFKNAVATFHWEIDGGARTFSAEQEKTTVHMYFCDTILHLKNVPSTFVNGAELGSEEKKWWATDEQNSTFDQQQIDDVMTTECVDTRSPFVRVCEPWRVRFYEHLSIRCGGIMFTRYLTRIIIKFASSLCYLITGYAIRNTPSSQILNMVMDHSGEMPTRMLIFGALFLTLDILECMIVMYVQMGEPRRKEYNFRRFARFFDKKKAFLIMIVSCHICCNSDVFLTFSSLKFCDKPSL